MARNRHRTATAEMCRRGGEPPRVSIVIPTRNRWGLLPRRGLRAALMQQDVEVEVIVVDDGSDMPPGEVEGLADPRVQLVRHERQLGAGSARNTGLRHAGYEWVAFLDDDDMWAPNKLAFLVDQIQLSGADFGYSSVFVLDRRMRLTELAPAHPAERLGEDIRRSCVIYAGPSNVVTRSTLIDELGGFDEELSAAADWEMWIRMATAGKAVAVQEPLLAYLQSAWVVENEGDYVEDHQRLTRKHRDVSPDQFAFSWWIAESHRRQGRRLSAARRFLAAGLRYNQPRGFLMACVALIDPRFPERIRSAKVGPPPDWLALYRRAHPSS